MWVNRIKNRSKILVAPIVVLGLAGTMGPASLASAAEVAGAVDAISFKDPASQLAIGDIAELEATWQVNEVAPGDTITISTPAQFEFYTENFEITMDDEDAVVVADCVATDEVTLSCTFTDAVAETPELSGILSVAVEAVAATTEESLDFGVGSETVAVDLPGEGGIATLLRPATSRVTGQPNSDGSITWVVALAGLQHPYATGDVRVCLVGEPDARPMTLSPDLYTVLVADTPDGTDYAGWLDLAPSPSSISDGCFDAFISQPSETIDTGLRFNTVPDALVEGETYRVTATFQVDEGSGPVEVNMAGEVIWPQPGSGTATGPDPDPVPEPDPDPVPEPDQLGPPAEPLLPNTGA